MSNSETYTCPTCGNTDSGCNDGECLVTLNKNLDYTDG